MNSYENDELGWREAILQAISTNNNNNNNNDKTDDDDDDHGNDDDDDKGWWWCCGDASENVGPRSQWESSVLLVITFL